MPSNRTVIYHDETLEVIKVDRKQVDLTYNDIIIRMVDSGNGGDGYPVRHPQMLERYFYGINPPCISGEFNDFIGGLTAIINTGNEKAWHSFLKQIQEYESDTFSAVRSKITLKEAGDIAEKILSAWIENQLDGVMLSEALSELRDE
jgi:hypothetical protein